LHHPEEPPPPPHRLWPNSPPELNRQRRLGTDRSHQLSRDQESRAATDADGTATGPRNRGICPRCDHDYRAAKETIGTVAATQGWRNVRPVQESVVARVHASTESHSR